MRTLVTNIKLWDNKNKKWAGSVGLFSDGLGASLSILNGTHSDDVAWIRSTGLKDKNGKEIYEGDIVKHSSLEHDTEDSPHIQEITYDIVAETSGFNIPWPISQYEVIGNIYENPELLERKGKA